VHNAFFCKESVYLHVKAPGRCRVSEVYGISAQTGLLPVSTSLFGLLQIYEPFLSFFEDYSQV
jgi:hypothetical protein